MASRRIEDLNEILAAAWTKAAQAYGRDYPDKPQPFITCTHRTNAEQRALYDQPRDGKDNNGNGIIDDKSEKVTQALPGQSPHNYLPALAFDVAFINPVTQKLDWGAEQFKRFAELIRIHQPLVVWGGDWNQNGETRDERFPDAPHFELRNWRSLITTKTT
jgi:peptidoglycan LD-endopeptidase CwlK